MEFYRHNIDPVIVALGPVEIRWYGTMYLVGFVLGFLLLARRHKRGLLAPNLDQIQTLLTYLILGMIVGSRLIYVLVYNPYYYMENLSEIPAIWKGGLSFHGAGLGFIVGVIMFARKYGFGFFHLMDSVVFGSALGIIFGRIGNFINGELYGRAADVPWAVIFPMGGEMPRHPSQLYQAFTEGLCVLLVLKLIERFEQKKGYAPMPYVATKGDTKIKKLQVEWKRTGILSAWFLILYGVARFIIEFFREPDVQLGFFFRYLSMGQILCTLMIISGLVILRLRIKKPIPASYTIRLEGEK